MIDLVDSQFTSANANFGHAPGVGAGAGAGGMGRTQNLHVQLNECGKGSCCAALLRYQQDP